MLRAKHSSPTEIAGSAEPGAVLVNGSTNALTRDFVEMLINRHCVGRHASEQGKSILLAYDILQRFGKAIVDPPQTQRLLAIQVQRLLYPASLGMLPNCADKFSSQ